MSELTIELLESALIESNLLSIASATVAVVPRLFEGCALPQLPTFIASLASAESSTFEETWMMLMLPWMLFPGVPTADASLSFTLDSSASQCFFRDCTTITSLFAPVSVALVDPTFGPAVAHNTTTLPYPTLSFGSLIGLHIPSFSRNLVVDSGGAGAGGAGSRGVGAGGAGAWGAGAGGAGAEHAGITAPTPTGHRYLTRF
ncbi:unnamed protein product [Closterium sp. NIES-54]